MNSQLEGSPHRSLIARSQRHRVCTANAFRSLGTHVVRGHQLLAFEYKAIFGLRATTSLLAPTLAERHRQQHLAVLSQYWALEARQALSDPLQRYARCRKEHVTYPCGGCPVAFSLSSTRHHWNRLVACTSRRPRIHATSHQDGFTLSAPPTQPEESNPTGVGVF